MVTLHILSFFLQRSFWGNQMCKYPREFLWFECERTESKVRGTCPHCLWQNMYQCMHLICLVCLLSMSWLFFFIFRQLVYGENSIEVEVKSYWRLFIEEVILLGSVTCIIFLADIYHGWFSFSRLTELSICLFYRWWTHSTCFRSPALFSGSVTSIITMLRVFSSYLSCPLESHCMKPKEWVYK